MNQISVRTFEKDCHVIHWGEALAALEQNVKDESIDLIFADPPYSIGKRFGNFEDKWPSEAAYVEWCKRWLELCIAKLKPTGSLYVMTSTQSIPYIDLFLRERIHILSRIVWHYDSSGVQAKRHYGSMYEPILFCVKDNKNYTFNASDIMIEARTGAQRELVDYRKSTPTLYNSQKVPGNVWYYPRVRYRMAEYENHPTQKPEALLARIILASSNPGDVVLDPFAGTFTTCAVARRLGRMTIGIEREEEYIRIGLRRCEFRQELDGVQLEPAQKNTERRNGKGSLSGSMRTESQGHFLW